MSKELKETKYAIYNEEKKCLLVDTFTGNLVLCETIRGAEIAIERMEEDSFTEKEYKTVDSLKVIKVTLKAQI